MLILAIDPSKTTGVALVECGSMVMPVPNEHFKAMLAQTQPKLLKSWLLHIQPKQRRLMTEAEQVRQLGAMFRDRVLAELHFDKTPGDGIECVAIEVPGDKHGKSSTWGGRVSPVALQLIGRFTQQADEWKLPTVNITPAEAKAAFGLRSTANKYAMMEKAGAIVDGYSRDGRTRYEAEAIADACAVALAAHQKLLDGS